MQDRAPLSFPVGASAHTRAHGESGRGPVTADSVVRLCQVLYVVLVVGLLVGGGVLGFMGLSRAGALTPLGIPAAPPAPGAVPAAAAPAGSGAASDIYWIVLAVSMVGTVAVCVGAGWWLKQQAAVQWSSRADDDAATARVYHGFMQRAFVRAAAVEGPGLAGAAFALITGNGLLLLATAASAVTMAALFPTGARMDRWIEEVTGGEGADADEAGEEGQGNV